MPDREKVIKGLEYCGSVNDCPGYICPYHRRLHCIKELTHDALELLKEQEPVKQGVWYMGPDNMWTCSECGQTWEVGDGWRWRFKYCPLCGAKNVGEKL